MLFGYNVASILKYFKFIFHKILQEGQFSQDVAKYLYYVVYMNCDKIMNTGVMDASLHEALMRS